MPDEILSECFSPDPEDETQEIDQKPIQNHRESMPYMYVYLQPPFFWHFYLIVSVADTRILEKLDFLSGCTLGKTRSPYIVSVEPGS